MTDVTSHSDGPRGQWILKHEHFVKRFGRIELLSLLMITCANCMLPPATAGLIATGPSQPAVGSSGTKGPIEAGCTFSGGDLQGDPGTIFRVACPQDCDHGGWLEGTDVYTSGSSICSAGIHAGAIPAGGGVMTVRIERGRPAYRGSAHNGIQSHDTGSADRSFAVVLPAGQGGAPAQAPPGALQVIEAGCTFSGGDLQGDPGTIFRVACPQDCDHGGWLEGTDVYTSGSSICSAGIHAGAIPAGGGVVTVRIERGRPAYRGTARNGIESHDTGSADRSFAVVVKR